MHGVTKIDRWLRINIYFQDFNGISPRLLGRSLFRWPHIFVAHRDELLGGARVDTNRRVELLLGGAAFYRDRQTLDDLGRIGAEHVTADDAVALGVDDHLHKRTLVPARQRVLHRPEARL